MNLFNYNGFRFSINLFLCLNSVLHLVLLPFNPALAVMCYKNVLISAVLAYAVSLHRQNRPIQFNLTTAQRMLNQIDAQYLIISAFFLFFGFINALFLVPLCLYGAFGLVAAIKSMRPPPPMTSTLELYMQKLLAKQTEALLYAASIEVMLGFLLLFGVFTGSSQIVTGLVYWNFFLSARYRTSKATGFVFGQLRRSLDSVFHHRYCPAILGMVWDRLVGFLRDFASR
eukprot:NODE_3969_length_887_cov_26.883055_g3657_i0.p1 GENE.NODE_3969_length_887_cov_26.883055_g3657_i0~~NODE_3969_length_887_cov_26.883055_g3657_i0.p1  ORF type:complete len:244 (+),score=54.95 NODE_3969_length_887_cov_26.883055_g3657_i0:50-733(+)